MVPGPQRHSTIQGKSRVALAIKAASRKFELDEGSVKPRQRPQRQANWI